jgi:predicted MFS family arabinose efflux permease
MMRRAVATTTEPEPRADAASRRLVIVVGAVVFVDTLFYAVLAPLLPQLVHELHLSKLSAGVMTAMYPAGTLIGSLPGGVLAARAGPSLTVRTGLALLAASTLAFAFLHSAVTLDVARFVEGAAGACSWAGGIAWVVAETSAERRGEVMGQALAAAIGGSLFGPVIGTLATAIGRPAAFSAIAAASLLLIGATRLLPEHPVRSGQGVRDLLSATRERGIPFGMWLVALPAMGSGLIGVLGPLRMHHFGASAAVVGAAFLVASAVEATISPIVGRISDRHGRLFPIRFGLIAAAAVLVCLTPPQTALGVAIVVVLVAASTAAFWAPALALLSDAAEALGLDQGLAAALVNIAWAAGQIAGSGVGGATAKAAGDGVPTFVAAGLCVATFAELARRRAAAAV